MINIETKELTQKLPENIHKKCGLNKQKKFDAEMVNKKIGKINIIYLSQGIKKEVMTKKIAICKKTNECKKTMEYKKIKSN